MKHEQEILSYIESAPYIDGEAPTNADVASVCELSDRTAAAVMQRLLLLRRVHIATWGQDTFGRWSVMRYGAGDGPDAARPPALTAAARVRAHRLRKAETEAV